MSQPNEPVRYGLQADDDGPGYHIGRSSFGDFILYDDYDALRRRCEELKKQAANLQNALLSLEKDARQMREASLDE